MTWLSSRVGQLTACQPSHQVDRDDRIHVKVDRADAGIKGPDTFERRLLTLASGVPIVIISWIKPSNTPSILARKVAALPVCDPGSAFDLVAWLRAARASESNIYRLGILEPVANALCVR